MVGTGDVVPSQRGEAEPFDRLTLALRGRRDPRLVELVRLLARQAADSCFEAAARREDDAPT